MANTTAHRPTKFTTTTPATRHPRVAQAARAANRVQRRQARLALATERFDELGPAGTGRHTAFAWVALYR